MTKMADGKNGGKLNRSGRKLGTKALISKTFEEFSRSLLEDPEIQVKIRERLLAELAGKKRNPLPCLGALAAAAVREKPSVERGASILFIAQITNGRGEVKRFELGPEAEELPAVELKALPAGIVMTESR